MNSPRNSAEQAAVLIPLFVAVILLMNVVFPGETSGCVGPPFDYETDATVTEPDDGETFPISGSLTGSASFSFHIEWNWGDSESFKLEGKIKIEFSDSSKEESQKEKTETVGPSNTEIIWSPTETTIVPSPLPALGGGTVSAILPYGVQVMK